MGDYRDEREAALQRAEVLSQQNAQLQTELAAMRRGKTTPATTRLPLAVGVAVGAMVLAGATAGFLTMSQRAPVALRAPTLELRGEWSPPASVARVGLRAAARAGGGTWVVGDRGTILFRPEGSRDWSSVPSGTDADLHAITSGEPLVVVGARGTALRFDPGERRWVAEATRSTADLHAVSSHQGTLVAVGDRGTVLWRTPDGAWLEAPHVTLPTTADLYGVALSPADLTFVAVGSGGTILSIAPRGGTTVNASPVTATLRAVAAWNNTLLAVGDGGVMVSATDHSPWTVVRSGSTDDLFAVAATEIPYEQRGPDSVGSGSTFGFVAAGARGSVLVDRLGSTQGWRPVRAGGGAVRAMTSEPWSFFTADGNTFGFAPR